MPRIQVLHLPAPPDEYPFAVVIDEAPEEFQRNIANIGEKLRDELGARALIVTGVTIEVL